MNCRMAWARVRPLRSTCNPGQCWRRNSRPRCFISWKQRRVTLPQPTTPPLPPVASYPRREVILGKKATPPFARLHVSDVGLEGARRQLEEQSLLVAALRPQHLLTQLGVVKLQRRAASATTHQTGGRRSQEVGGVGGAARTYSISCPRGK